MCLVSGDDVVPARTVVDDWPGIPACGEIGEYQLVDWKVSEKAVTETPKLWAEKHFHNRLRIQLRLPYST
eukprot:4339374-Amphidinium_carterae.1